MTHTCEHGPRIYREGTGKTGKPFKAYFCPQPKGEPQCAVEWATDAPGGKQTPSTAPNQATELLASIDAKLGDILTLLRESKTK